MFGDPSLEGDNAVYCWRKQGEIQTLVGPYDHVHEIFRAEQKADQSESEKDPHGRLMLKLLAAAVALIAAAAMLLDGAPVVGTLVFAVVAWFPAFVLFDTKHHDYETDEMFEQFRRYHGAEHAVVIARKKNEASWEGDDLTRMPYLENECGTVYMATLLVWALISGITIALFPHLGLMKTAGIIFAAMVLLLLNLWFNPANPLRRAQLRVVARPGAAELELASKCLQEFARLGKAAEKAKAGKAKASSE